MDRESEGASEAKERTEGRDRRAGGGEELEVEEEGLGNVRLGVVVVGVVMDVKDVDGI